MAGGKNRRKIKDMFSPPSASSLGNVVSTPNGSNASLTPETESTPGAGDDLLDDLMAQLDAKDDATKGEAAQVLHDVAKQEAKETQALEGKGKKLSSKEKFKARQARKAEALAASYAPIDASADTKLEAEARAEEAAIRAVCFKSHLEMWECPPDGNCMFTAVADQLSILGFLPQGEARPETTRKAAAEYMRAHPDDFLPFLPSMEGEDGTGATDDGIMTSHQYAKYCDNIEGTAQWGGQPELLALAKAYGVEIDVVQGGTPSVVKTRPSEDGKHLPIATISYHRRMYGLGEHYNSLRPLERHSFSIPLPHLGGHRGHTHGSEHEHRHRHNRSQSH